jgi:hypothetical protein
MMREGKSVRFIADPLQKEQSLTASGKDNGSIFPWNPEFFEALR